MRKLAFRWAASILGVTAFSSAVAQTYEATEFGIYVGQIIGTRIDNINGWGHASSGLYAGRQWNIQLQAIIEKDTCCYAVFTKGDDIVVARTSSIASGPRGGAVAERIDEIFVTRRLAGEQLVESCQIGSVDPELNLYNPESRVVRSVIVRDSDFVEIEWKDRDFSCYLGE